VFITIKPQTRHQVVKKRNHIFILLGVNESNNPKVRAKMLIISKYCMIRKYNVIHATKGTFLPILFAKMNSFYTEPTFS